MGFSPKKEVKEGMMPWSGGAVGDTGVKRFRFG
jgi:hypothetical protein